MITVRDIAAYLNARTSGGPLDAVVAPASHIVTNESRRVMPGGIFVAIKGAHTDGHRFVGEAAKRGAIAIVSEQPRAPESAPAAWLQVANARAALAQAAALVHDHPSRKLKLIGLTGTNGKTTTTHIIEAICQAAGAKTALMGTIAYHIGEQELPAAFTTPEAPEIQGFLARAVEAGVTHAVMEVSSIALALHRADELQFAVAAFTNLTQDHLDFHGTLEAYFAAKRRLFDGSIGARPAHAVLNLDDPYGAQLRAVCEPKVLSYALDAAADIAPADKNAVQSFGLDGLRFTARTPAGEIEINSALVGRPHAYNTLCAIGVGLALGFDLQVIARGISQCRGVAGRFERVSTFEEDITVVVDYAHTPDALANVLGTVRAAQTDQHGRVITVMGCGGDRDRSKRPLMGEAAAQLSDWVIATSDNPRSEDPLLILNDIRVGLDRVSQNYELIVDRREAIYRAIAQAKANDVVLIAGKGHETYQILPTGRIHFDDREVARAALAERRNLKSQI